MSDKRTTRQDLIDYANDLEALGAVSGRPTRLFSVPGFGVNPESRPALTEGLDWAWENRRKLFDIHAGINVEQNTADLSAEAKRLAENVKRTAQDW